MSIPPVSLVAMTFAVTSMVVALAMFFLVLWQAPRQRNNQLAALYMFEVVCWAAMSLLLRVSGLAGMDPTPFFFGIILGIGFNGLLLFTLISHYSGLWKRWYVLAVILAGLAYYLVTLPLLFGGELLTGFAITPNGELKFRFELLGYVAFGIAYVFYLLSLGVLWGSRKSPAGVLLPGSTIITAGVLTSIHPILSQYSIAIMSAGVSTILFAHSFLKENLFNPLALLNQELRDANARLSHLTRDLQAANEQLVEASHLKSNFLASMSHELRTPLNSILGYSDMLLQGAYGPLNEKQTDRLEVVIRSGRHLLQLISDILDLSKIEAGQLQLSIHPLDIGPVLDECFAIFEPLAGKKGLSLNRAVAPDLKPVLADRGRVMQILVNLVSNGIKFTHAGSVTVHAQAADPQMGMPPGLLPSKAGWLLLTVEDTGIGISTADQAIIFDEFRQADGSLTREYEGTGLGLAISRRLTRMMNGEIWVESQPDQGSRFHVVLPLAGVEPTQAEVGSQPVSHGASREAAPAPTGKPGGRES